MTGSREQWDNYFGSGTVTFHRLNGILAVWCQTREDELNDQYRSLAESRWQCESEAGSKGGINAKWWQRYHVVVQQNFHSHCGNLVTCPPLNQTCKRFESLIFKNTNWFAT